MSAHLDTSSHVGTKASMRRRCALPSDGRLAGRATSYAIACALLWGCAGAAPHPAQLARAQPAPAESQAAISSVLDEFHAAAARADETAYFNCFAPEGVFLGTDATERWTVAEFRAYAHPFFERGRAWSFRAARRALEVSEAGDFAWFDEDLETENLGPARGSGVLRRVAPGDWRIVHYNLTITVPNERFDEVRNVLSAPTPEVESALPTSPESGSQGELGPSPQ